MLVLLDKSGKRHFVIEGKDVHTSKGVIRKEDLVPGRIARTHKGYEFLVLRPTVSDLVQSIKGGAKPIYEYHSGIFAYLLGLGKGKNLLEAGTGSAGATLVFANTVYPGKVITFEKEKRFYKVAREVISRSGFDNIILINDDVRNASEYLEKKKIGIDSAFLDLQDPERYVGELARILPQGGFLGVYTPVFDSVKPVWEEMEKSGFVGINAILLNMERVLVKKYARLDQEHFGFPGIFIWGRKFGGV